MDEGYVVLESKTLVSQCIKWMSIYFILWVMNGRERDSPFNGNLHLTALPNIPLKGSTVNNLILSHRETFTRFKGKTKNQWKKKQTYKLQYQKKGKV